MGKKDHSACTSSGEYSTRVIYQGFRETVSYITSKLVSKHYIKSGNHITSKLVNTLFSSSLQHFVPQLVSAGRMLLGIEGSFCSAYSSFERVKLFYEHMFWAIIVLQCDNYIGLLNCIKFYTVCCCNTNVRCHHSAVKMVQLHVMTAIHEKQYCIITTG